MDRDLASWTVTSTQERLLALLLDGALAPLRGFLRPAELTSVRAEGRLPDGTVWRGEPTLTVPEPVAVAARRAGRLVLCDLEGTRIGVLTVADGAPLDPTRWQLGGPVEALEPPAPLAFADLHVPLPGLRAELARSRHLSVVQPTAVPDRTALDRWARHVEATGGDLVVQPVACPGTTSPERWAALVRAHRRAIAHLRDGRVRLHLAPLPEDGEVADAAALRVVVAANLGARTLLDVPPGTLDRAGPLAAARGLQLVLSDPSTGGTTHRPDVAAERSTTTATGGVVVFLTGLSGAGKSTIARGLRARLLESGARTVTLLDGDRVRRTLSRGLGFSAEDRETNVRRIGWVAAEVARHGGVAVCAPIAPEDRVRRAVRADVVAAGGRFVLVHVATPLEVCEARDPKGLYAAARDGRLSGLTGVDAPYEPPRDAEVVVDTAAMELTAAVDLLELAVCGRVPAPVA